MSQHDLDIANQTFPNTRSDLNNALQALGSTSSGATVPSTTYANQIWYSTTDNKLYIRNEDNDANIEICELDQTNDSVEFFKADSIRTALVEYTDGTDALTVGSGGELTTSSTLDVDGNELILDSDGDTSITSDTDDQIDFKTGGTDRMHIDSSGNVGIGTSSPQGKLDIDGKLVFEVGSTRWIAQNRSGSISNVLWKDTTATDNLNLFNPNASNLIFGTSNTEHMRIDSIGNLKFNSGYGSVATAYGCRAWVSFNGTGTVAIRESGNVSSITDNGTGDYRVNFATAMPDTNYAISTCPARYTGDTKIREVVLDNNISSTSNVSIHTAFEGSTDTYILDDSVYVFLQVFR